jgi:hypothetical protein
MIFVKAAACFGEWISVQKKNWYVMTQSFDLPIHRLGHEYRFLSSSAAPPFWSLRFLSRLNLSLVTALKCYLWVWPLFRMPEIDLGYIPYTELQ